MWKMRKDAWYGKILVVLFTLMDKEGEELHKNNSNNKDPEYSK